jgi:hypothetical protein
MRERIRPIVERPWKAVVLDSGDSHVIPLFDLKEHNTLSEECHCRPMIHRCMGGCHTMSVHRSYDGREVLEQALAMAWNERN